jgi:hypothetical protein
VREHRAAPTPLSLLFPIRSADRSLDLLLGRVVRVLKLSKDLL